MQRCLDLAKNGLGTTYPNPLVGCVVVKDNVIISEGWHYKAGERHAEAQAINGLKDKKLLAGATLYVSLEPCNHYGRTPPCAHLIADSGITKVVVGAKDANPVVNGSGIAYLQANGIEVITDVLCHQAEALNKRFFTFIKKQRPYIILKWAETSNGYSAPLSKDLKRPVWITTPESRQHVHKLRAQEQAILIGSATLRQDNPRLTAKDWNNINPQAFVLGQPKISDEALTLFKDPSHAQWINPKQQWSAHQIAQHLYKNGIQSVLVEGGTQTIQSFIDQDLWDECYIYRSSVKWQSGISGPRLKTKTTKASVSFGQDQLHHLLFKKETFSPKVSIQPS